MSFAVKSRSLDAKTAQLTKARYGDFIFKVRPNVTLRTCLGRCEDLMRIGQHLLKTDGGLMMQFFIEGEGFWLPIGFQPRDRADKHALVREVADYVLLHRAELVMCISEMDAGESRSE